MILALQKVIPISVFICCGGHNRRQCGYCAGAVCKNSFMLSIQASFRLSRYKRKPITPIANHEWGYTFLADDAGCFVFILSYIQTNAMPNPDSCFWLATNSVALLKETVDAFEALVLEWVSLV